MKLRQRGYAVKTFKLLSNANRLQIIELLSQKHLQAPNVNMIAEKLSLEVSNVSNHLIKLRENGIVKAKQDGLSMHYKIKDSRVLEFVDLAKKLC